MGPPALDPPHSVPSPQACTFEALTGVRLYLDGLQVASTKPTALLAAATSGQAPARGPSSPSLVMGFALVFHHTRLLIQKLVAVIWGRGARLQGLLCPHIGSHLNPCPKLGKWTL